MKSRRLASKHKSGSARDTVITRIVPVATPAKDRAIPDFATMRREIFGGGILPGADLLIEERKKSRY